MRRAATIWTLWLALVFLVVWSSGQFKYHKGSKLLLPLLPSRLLRVEVWPVVVLADRDSPYGYSSFSDEPTNARWVGIWYHDLAAGATERLAAFTVPTWPLNVDAAGTSLVLLLLQLHHGARQARPRSFHHHDLAESHARDGHAPAAVDGTER
jgi:hypothetical protein